jgi:hypothetical protein
MRTVLKCLLTFSSKGNVLGKYSVSYLIVVVVAPVDGVRVCLWTAATKGTIVHPPGASRPLWVWRGTVEWYWQGKTEELGEKPVSVPLCPPQIPHELTRARTRFSAARGRRLTAWAIAWPVGYLLNSFDFRLYKSCGLNVAFRTSTRGRGTQSWTSHVMPLF